MIVDYGDYPKNLEAERAVLGACIFSKEALGDVIEVLKPDDFYDYNNKIAYEALVDMYLRDAPIDFVTVSSELTARGIFDQLGGQPFLAELITRITTTANVIYHAELVKENAIRRRLIDAGDKLIKLSYQDDKSTKETIEEIEKLISDAVQNKNSSDFRHVKDLLGSIVIGLEGRLKNPGEKITRYYSKFTDLDMYIGGFQPGSLNIIAARPSMGKTAFALNIAQFGGDDELNLPILIFSIEMPAEQLIFRMLSAESRVELSSITQGTFNTSDFKRVKEAAEIISSKNIYINDDSTLSAIDFRTKCRRFKTKNQNVGLIIVDYLQLMSSGTERTEGRQQEVSDISRMLKAVARELNCPVIALSQLSRATEMRTEKKPQLSDLRDSGAIEQDADTVMLMFREDYYSDNENNSLQNSEASIRVAKNRNGSTGTFKLIFEREFTKFSGFGGRE